MKGSSSNRVKNIYFNENENNNSELYLNENKDESEIGNKLKEFDIGENIFDNEIIKEDENK